MTYQECLEYLFSKLPMYQRVGSAAYKADLSNTIAICDLLNNPQNNLKFIHVAGTNGKGSTSHLITSVLQEQGYKVGLYTSPHYKDFRERIKINKENVSEKFVVDFVERYQEIFTQINPSFFEWTFGLALAYFEAQKVDYCVLETGMGGRLDSTNIVTPIVSVITNIGYDHTQFLGDTLEKIAGEKAGIIKKGVPVIIGETQSEITAVFIEKSRQLETDIYFADMCINETPVSSLNAIYQEKNKKTALQTIYVLRENGIVITEQSIKKGFANVIANTSMIGRWQKLGNNPLCYCDAAHNIQGIQVLLEQLKRIKFEKLHVVFGTVNDKDMDEILNILPKNATYYFTQASIPRALDKFILKEKANKFGLKGNTYSSVQSALDYAKNNAKNNDLVLVTGSIFIVAEVL